MAKPKHKFKKGDTTPHLPSRDKRLVTVTRCHPDGSYSVKEFCGKIPAEHLEGVEGPTVEK